MPEQRKLAVSEIDPDPEQPRKEFAEAEIIALGENMKKVGQQVPVIVYAVEVIEAEGRK